MSEEKKGNDIWMWIVRVSAIAGLNVLGFLTLEVFQLKSEVRALSAGVQEMQKLREDFVNHKTLLAHPGQVQWNHIVEIKLEKMDSKLDRLLIKKN